MKRADARHIVFVMLSVACLCGCSTQKAKWTNITYHNTTCHYNVWWNGNESLQEGLRTLEKKHTDDYTQILPVYKLGTQEQAMTVKAQFDRAIEKGVKGIKKHSIYLKGKEHVAYVRKCYLLTAYASFYEHEYADAANTCRTIASQYSGTQDADEARILLARCYTQQKQYIDAETLLDQLVNDYNSNNLSGKLTDKLYAAMVECTLPQEKYKKAVQYLRLALDETTNHYQKARLYYIMAQVYQTLDKRPTAQKYFKKVIECRPDYIMEFNARISMASCTDINHTNLEEQVKAMDKMLKDKKNESFKDQIYYAKGEMYMGAKDAQKACDNYKLSVASAGNNPAQKAKSALRMADVLYDVYENYDQAQSYYDTAMHIINIEYPHYDEIEDRYNTLTALTEYTRKIELNDSLMALADMEPQVRQAMIEKQIAELKEKEAKAKEEALLEELRQDAKKQQYSLEGDWYFYNHNTVQKGKDQFRQRWGNRTLEDYWFLSKKGMLAMGMAMAPIADGDESDIEMDSITRDSLDMVNMRKQQASKNDPNDPHNAAYYLKDMPTRQGQRDTMNAEIATCLLNAGYLYYDGIKNTDRALDCYLRLATDYADAPEIEPAFYQLYRIYTKQGNTPSANYYRDMVLMGFPDGDFANMIRDDNYYLEIIRRQEMAQNEYANIYSLFRRHRYTDVIERARQAQQVYKQEPLHAKFRYWEAMAIMQTGNREESIRLFDSIVHSYVDTNQVVALAQLQLDYLRGDPTLANKMQQNGNQDEVITAQDEAQARSRYANTTSRDNIDEEEAELPAASRMYRYRENMNHYVVVLINDKAIVATQLQYKIADFNSQQYANMGYKVSPLMFTDSTQMLTIHRFKNADEAMKYFRHFQLAGGPMEQYDPKDYVVFPISTQNYTSFYRQKDVDAYLIFFNRYYNNK